MKKGTALRSIGGLCILYMILSSFMSALFCVYLHITISMLCLFLLVLTRLNWRKKLMMHWKSKSVSEKEIYLNGRSKWRTGVKEIDELYISGYYWAIASLIVPMFDLPFWCSYFKSILL